MSVQHATEHLDEHGSEPKGERSFFRHHLPGDVGYQPVGECTMRHAPGDAEAGSVILLPRIVPCKPEQGIENGERPEPGARQWHGNAPVTEA